MIKSGFYNSKGNDRQYYAEDINMPYKKIISNGVIPVPSSAFQVLAAEGMAVKIAPGNGMFGNRWAENTTDLVLEIDAAHATLNRIDLIVIRSDSTETVRNTDAFIIKGTPASAPVAPKITRSDYIQEYVLAEVRVNAGVTAITQAAITDTRADTTRCGWCTSLIEQVDTSALFRQWQAAYEEAFNENQDDFNEWFSSIKEYLATSTLIRQYVNRYDVEMDGVTNIPIGISQFNVNIDILEVYINGFNAIPTVDYSVNGSESITLNHAVDAGTIVVFKVFKSIDGSEAETVINQVVELQNKVAAIEENIYYCNGYNDNEDLKTFIDNWLLNSPSKDKIEIVGKFANNSSAMVASDGNAYNFVYELAAGRNLVLDFTKCEIINAENNFMYLSNVEAVNCTVKYDGVNTSVIGFAGNAAAFTGCEVKGTIVGGESYGFKGDKLKLTNCHANLVNVGAIYGASVTDSLLEGCDLYAESTGASAYGVSMAAESRANNCNFEGKTGANGTTYSGSGGIGGGYFSGCRFIGSGALKGYGFYVRAAHLLNAANCIFRGYTKDSANGIGAGLTGVNDSGNTYLLNGITCNQVTVDGYSQTASMDLPGGYGVVSGVFYAAITANTNLTSVGVFNRNRV